MTSRTLDSITGAKRVVVKCENFQRTGSFKFRGAWNVLSHLSPIERDNGIIAHSSGNFAQAIALVAKIFKMKATIVMPNATIVMPNNATPSKIEATQGYGADVVLCGNNPGDREKMVNDLVQKYAYKLVHPFDDYKVIFGAGRGLISGCSIAAKGLNPRIKVVGVEPKNADDAYRSFQLGERVPVENPNTIADGLRTSVGEKTFPIIKEFVDDIITVTEEQIIDAMRFYWERMKLIVEPSGAVPLAGILSGNIESQLIKISTLKEKYSI